MLLRVAAASIYELIQLDVLNKTESMQIIILTLVALVKSLSWTDATTLR